MKFYTGVGSRETPRDICQLMMHVATWLATKGWILRSGHAQGADRAFELGAGEASVIYLPWPNFGVTRYKEDPGMALLGKGVVGKRQELLTNFDELLRLKIHPGAGRESVKLLHGRNVWQVRGQEGEPHSKMCICWCEERNGVPQGGTATAYKLAVHHGIPVFNLWRDADRERIEAKIRS